MLWLFGNGTMLQPPGNNCGLWNTSYYIRWAGLNGCKRPVARVNVLNKNPTVHQSPTLLPGRPPARPSATHRTHAMHMACGHMAWPSGLAVIYETDQLSGRPGAAPQPKYILHDGLRPDYIKWCETVEL